MALGCVRVDLTVRLGRGVEGFDSTKACILGVALHVSICGVAIYVLICEIPGAQHRKTKTIKLLLLPECAANRNRGKTNKKYW